jgi:hypothetical protein
MDSVCHNCPTRTATCHCTCSRHRAERERTAQARAKNKLAAATNAAITDMAFRNKHRNEVIA